jgi:hypothetical protein
VSPPHLFPIVPHAQQGGDKNTYPKIENIYGNQFDSINKANFVIINHSIN